VTWAPGQKTRNLPTFDVQGVFVAVSTEFLQLQRRRPVGSHLGRLVVSASAIRTAQGNRDPG
jgi:hypothetical protein